MVKVKPSNRKVNIPRDRNFMNDLTFAEISTALTAYPEMATWWNAAGALPANTTVAEFFAKTLNAASRAAITKNANLPAGSRIAAYPAPISGAMTIDANGFGSYLATFSVQARVSTDLNIAVAPNA